MAHNFLHGTPPQASPSLPGEPKALIDRFLDAIWMERGLSENTLGAYRADLVALNHRLATRGVELARASRADVLDYIAWRVESGAKPRSTARQLSSFRRFYRYLLREGVLTEDPTAQIAMPKIGRARRPRAYEAVRAALTIVPSPEAMSLRAAVHPEISIETYLRTNAGANPPPWEYDYNHRLPLFGIPVDFWIGDGVYGVMDISLKQNHDGVSSQLVASNYTNWTTNLDVLDTEIPQRAFVSTGGPHWSFVIGRDRLTWGDGQTGNLVLSDAPDFNDFARLTAYWDNFKYTAMWIALTYGLDPQYRFPVWGPLGDGQSNNNYPRNFFLHRLDFSLFDRISIGLTEGILIGGVQPELVYFNPLMIFHDLYHWGHASTIASLEISANPWKYFDLYGELAFNQIQSAYELIRYGAAAATSPNASSALGGVRARVPVWEGYIDAGAEGVFVSPWMYIRENRLISYEWWRWTNSNVAGSPQWVSSPLGYFTGPDATVFAAWVGYNLPGLLTVGLDFKRVAQGQQTLATPYAEGPADVALQTPTGMPEYKNVLHLSASGDPLSFLRVSTDLYWIAIENFEHAPGVSSSDFQATVSVTVHKDL